MRKVCFGVICAAVIGLTSSAFASECSRPSAPNIPDGNTASRDEIIAGNKAIKEYVAATNAYIDCVDSEEKAAVAKVPATTADGKPNTAEQNKVHETYITLHNSAVDAIQGVADQFNASVRAYKAKNPPAAPAAQPEQK